MKAYDQALAPDERHQITMINDPITGVRPITFDDHYAMVADLTLPHGAPDVVARNYVRALHVLLYGWFDYELMVVAAGQALASLEFALKLRLGETVAKERGLTRRLACAVKLGAIAPPQTGSWGDTHALLVKVRNEIAHGTDHVYGCDMAEAIFHHCRSLICELNGLSEPVRSQAPNQGISYSRS